MSRTHSVPKSSDREIEPRFRPAMIGDKGTMVGQVSQSVSGLMTLAIEIEPDEIALLSGDWRCIQTIADELAGQEIEVIEADGSEWGLHNVLPINANQ